MTIQVREKSVDEMKKKLAGMFTDLNKITYVESALKETGFSFEIKRFLWGELAKFYVGRKMFEKAARAQANRASMEITMRDKMESYILSAEYFAKIGKIDTCEDMFVRASRDATPEQNARVKLARRNIYFACAKELEETGKRAGAVKFYERLMKMELDSLERTMIKDKLIKAYNGLGLFREAKMLDSSQ
jgi:tetratricopeptide (TPR) repeat protein